MYEEVEINTPLELARYLVNEGDLYSEGKQRIYFDKKAVNSNPFLVSTWTGEPAIMRVFWDTLTNRYYKKLNWHDCIPEGKKVPCYVSNINVTPDGSDSVTYITHCDPALECAYLMINGDRVKYATPIPAAELWVPEL